MHSERNELRPTQSYSSPFEAGAELIDGEAPRALTVRARAVDTVRRERPLGSETSTSGRT